MKILLTGGAGYIGSHTAWAAVDSGINVVILDNLSTGILENCPPQAAFYEGDVGNAALLDRLMSENKFDAVLHFAGSIVVPESVADPLTYYRNNVTNSLTLIDACVRHDIPKFIFSSTAAVYGIPEQGTVYEDTVTCPINPYGNSKLMVENILRDVSASCGLQTGTLRYFNVAGADPQGRTGQSSPKATHLIKVAVQYLLGKQDHISLFGEDYPTPDGTCIRDYIHVSDLATAHLAVLEALRKNPENLTLNCGIGRAFSVREVLETVAKVANRPLSIVSAPARPGDHPLWSQMRTGFGR